MYNMLDPVSDSATPPHIPHSFLKAACSDAGDGGVDFQIGDMTIDVKTTNNIDIGLLVPVIMNSREEVRRQDTYLVLAHYRSADTVTLVGWIRDADARTFRSDVVIGRGPLNHIVPLARLSPLDLLHARMQEAKRSIVV